MMTPSEAGKIKVKYFSATRSGDRKSDTYVTLCSQHGTPGHTDQLDVNKSVRGFRKGRSGSGGASFTSLAEKLRADMHKVLEMHNER